MTKEIWKKIPDYSNYEVSNLGNIRGLNGYKASPFILVKIKNDTDLNMRSAKQRQLGYYIALTFNGSCPEGKILSHQDGNALNNKPENLAWETHQQNCWRARSHGPRVKGEKNSQAKLTEKDVLEIRQLLSLNKYTQWQIAIKYGIKECTISAIKNNRLWSYIQLEKE